MRLLDLIRPMLPVLLRDLVHAVDRDGADKLATRFDAELGPHLTRADALTLALLTRTLSAALHARAQLLKQP